MTILRLVGGLGNQMHQYAFGRAVSLERGDKLFLDTNPFYYDTREYELDIFNIHASIATNKERPRYLKLWKNKFGDTLRYPLSFICKKCDPCYLIENPLHPRAHRGMFNFNSDIISKAKNKKCEIYLEGFRHSEIYFKKHADTIRKDFTLKIPIQDSLNKEILEKMDGCNSISIHIRRTDYITLSHTGYILCGLEYYHHAIQTIKEKVDNPIFFVFSDDIQRCKENFKEYNITHFIDWNTKENSYKDMILMAKCKHNIIANSTFSRRGARLNDNPNKIVIAPKKRHKTIDYADIIPGEWIRI